jgi:hypothetical protein
MMLKTVCLVSALLLASAVPAFAQSACAEPIAPVAIDGGAATTAQMNAAHDDVMTFLKQSDDYQVCLLKELKDARDAAKKDKKELDPSVEAGVTAKVQANQSLKEKVGAEYNAAVIAYKGKHPG